MPLIPLIVPPVDVIAPVRLPFVIVPPARFKLLIVCGRLPRLSVAPVLTVVALLAENAFAAPASRVPALIVVTPVYVLAPESVSIPPPFLVTVPLPDMTFEYVAALDLSNINEPLLVIFPDRFPAVPVLPSCKVDPESIVVMPV